MLVYNLLLDIIALSKWSQIKLANMWKESFINIFLLILKDLRICDSCRKDDIYLKIRSFWRNEKFFIVNYVVCLDTNGDISYRNEYLY